VRCTKSGQPRIGKLDSAGASRSAQGFRAEVFHAPAPCPRPDGVMANRLGPRKRCSSRSGRGPLGEQLARALPPTIWHSRTTSSPDWGSFLNFNDFRLVFSPVRVRTTTQSRRPPIPLHSTAQAGPKARKGRCNGRHPPHFAALANDIGPDRVAANTALRTARVPVRTAGRAGRFGDLAKIAFCPC